MFDSRESSLTQRVKCKNYAVDGHLHIINMSQWPKPAKDLQINFLVVLALSHLQYSCVYARKPTVKWLTHYLITKILVHVIFKKKPKTNTKPTARFWVLWCRICKLLHGFLKCNITVKHKWFLIKSNKLKWSKIFQDFMTESWWAQISKALLSLFGRKNIFLTLPESFQRQSAADMMYNDCR